MILSYLCTREAPLLSILRRELALSSGLVKRLKWQDALLLNGVPVHTNARVRPGDRVTVDLSETVVGYEGEDVPRGRLLPRRRQTARDACPSVAEAELRHTGQCRARLLSAHRTGLRCPPGDAAGSRHIWRRFVRKKCLYPRKILRNAEETSNFKDLSCQRLRHKNGRFRADRPADPEAAGKKPSPDCRTKREEMQNIICCFSTLSGRFSAGIEAGHWENAPAARTL